MMVLPLVFRAKRIPAGTRTPPDAADAPEPLPMAPTNGPAVIDELVEVLIDDPKGERVAR